MEFLLMKPSNLNDRRLNAGGETSVSDPESDARSLHNGDCAMSSRLIQMPSSGHMLGLFQIQASRSSRSMYDQMESKILCQIMSYTANYSLESQAKKGQRGLSIQISLSISD